MTIETDRAPAARGLTVRAGILPSLFVVLCLIALLAGPLVIQTRVRALTTEIQSAADPARTAVTRIQYLLARQTSVLRGYLISGDEDFLRQFSDLRVQEKEMYERLAFLAERLGPQVVIRLTELRVMSSNWHSDVAEEIARMADGVPEAVGIPFDRDDYLATLDAAGRFDQAVVDATVRRQRQIRAAEDRMAVAQVGLVAIALLAAATTAWLGIRVRRSALVAEARRVQAEEALEQTARAVQAKARLIRGVTHDVKNPLGAADGYAELLELGVRGPLTPEQAQMVTGIRRSIQSGLSIISDMLELAGAEGGSLALHLSAVSLPALIHEISEDYSGAATAAGLALAVDLPEGDILVHTDPLRVKQILSNLLSNAIKYSPAGGVVRLELELLSKEGSVLIHVNDSGRGIPAEYQERVFEEFERLPGSGLHGHGLGLAIARRIARLLDGDLTLESDGRTGSRFSLRLPAPDAESSLLRA